MRSLSKTCSGEMKMVWKRLEELIRKLGGEIINVVRLATPEEVKQITGFDVGAVPPVGVEVETIIDKKVLENNFVIGGGGRIDRLVKLNPKRIVEHQTIFVYAKVFQNRLYLFGIFKYILDGFSITQVEFRIQKSFICQLTC